MALGLLPHGTGFREPPPGPVRRQAVARPRKALALIGLVALVGCGGSSSISNAAQVRFFNVLKSTNANNTNVNTSNVRLIVGGRLYEEGGDTSFSYGDGLSGYGDAPSGSSEAITVSPYSDAGTTTATLATANLISGRHYTLIALTSGVTTSGVVVTDAQALLLLPDFLTQTSGTEYFRIVNASPAHSPVYLKLVNSSGTTVYPISTIGTVQGLASGASTGYQALTTSNTSDTYTLELFSDSTFTNPIGQTSVSLSSGSPKTIVIYDPSSSSTNGDLKFKTVSDSTDGTSTTTTSG